MSSSKLPGSTEHAHEQARTSAKLVAVDPPSLPAMFADVFDRLGIALRVRLLSRLLASVGPLALAVLGGGVFAKYVLRTRWTEIPVSLEDAARLSSNQVYELARYVEQSNPHVLDSLLAALSQDALATTAIGVSLIAIAIKQHSRRGASTASSSD